MIRSVALKCLAVNCLVRVRYEALLLERCLGLIVLDKTGTLLAVNCFPLLPIGTVINLRFRCCSRAVHVYSIHFFSSVILI